MATPYSDTKSDDLSNALFENLTDEVNWEIPNIDLDGPLYNLGETTTNPLYAAVSRVGLDELTSREIGGTGVFDALMDTYSKHIKIEHEKGRITGTEYAQAYVSLVSNAMSQSIQFLLGKDQAYWQALLVQAQTKAAEISAIQALVQLEQLKAEYRMATIGVEKSKADFALTKMQLATEDVKYDLMKTQDQIEEYKLSNIIPMEYTILQENLQMAIEQRTTVTRERAKLDYEINTLMPDQHALTEAQIEASQTQNQKLLAEVTALNFDVQQMLPAQLLKLGAETDVVEQAVLKAQYEISTLMPDQHSLTLQQIAKMTKEVEVLTFDIEEVKPVELAGLQAQTAMTEAQRDKAEYEVTTLLPDAHNKNLKELDLANNQILKTTKDIEMLDFQLTDMLPAELNKLTNEISHLNMQTNKVSADRDNVVYSTNFLLPSQRENLIADTTVKQNTATMVLPAQVAGMEADTLAKEYTRTQILPVQRLVTQETAEAKRAETLNTRSDGQVVAGSVGRQKELYQQQITSYQRDAEHKIGKLMLDAWVTQKGVDEGTDVPAQLNETALNRVMTVIRSNLSLT